MYKRILAFAAAVLVMGALAGCGGSAASGSASAGAASADASSTVSVEAPAPNLQDIASTRRVFLTGEGDGYEEYVIVFSGKDTGALKSFVDAVRFYKSAGFTQEMLESYDVEAVYPGFNSLSFVEKTIEEKKGLGSQGDYYLMILRFDDLKNKDNLLALDERGILTLENKNVNAVTGESLCDLIMKNGGQEIDSGDSSLLGLPIM